MMNKILKTILIISMTYTAQSQVTSIATLNTTTPDDGVYVKDLENKLPFWVGTWKGEVNNLKYTFQFDLFLQHLKEFPSGSYYYKDELKGKFKVEDMNGNVLYDDINNSLYNNYKINFLINRSNEYFFSFMDSVDNCYNSAFISFVKDDIDNTKITCEPFIYDDFDNFDNCPFQNQADIPMFLPTSEFVLTKQ